MWSGRCIQAAYSPQAASSCKFETRRRVYFEHITVSILRIRKESGLQDIGLRWFPDDVLQTMALPYMLLLDQGISMSSSTARFPETKRMKVWEALQKAWAPGVEAYSGICLEELRTRHTDPQKLEQA